MTSSYVITALDTMPVVTASFTEIRTPYRETIFAPLSDLIG